MHIITGMLIAGIFGRKRKASLLPMLRKGPVQTAHLLPGRVRFHVPSLVDQPAEAEDLCSRLSTLDGVEDVQTTSSSGSVLIRYREKLVRPELLFAAIVRLLGLERELEHTPQPVVTRELRSVFSSLNRVVYDRTGGLLDFTSALLILMAAFGVSKIMKEGSASIPPGFALLWWGVHHLFGQQGE